MLDLPKKHIETVFVPPKTNDMEIYSNFRWPDDIPKKPIDQLTPDQQQRILGLYRFSGFRPGMYQGITGKGSGCE